VSVLTGEALVVFVGHARTNEAGSRRSREGRLTGT
jgi:hypothetical protein